MELQFPDALISEFQTKLSEHGAQLTPNEGTLRRLLSLAFYAGLEREEGRHLSFALMLVDHNAMHSKARHCWSAFRFAEPVPATVREVVRLAPATHPDQTSIAVTDANSSLEIAGIVRTNRDWTRMARDVSNQATSVDMRYPRVVALSPGNLGLGLHDYEFIRFAGGVVLPEPVPVLHFGGPVLQALDKITRGLAGVAGHPPEAYARVLRQALREMSARAHGGTVMVVPSEAAAGCVTAKYRGSSRDFTESVHAYSEALARKQDTESRGLKATGADRATALYQAWQALFGLPRQEHYLSDAASALGDLAGIDGAVVLGPGFELLAFGAMFPRVDDDFPVAHAKDHDGTTREEMDLRSFGSRHRSAAAFCHDHIGAIGLVVSQDGDLSCLLRPAEDEPLLVWRPVPLDWTMRMPPT